MVPQKAVAAVDASWLELCEEIPEQERGLAFAFRIWDSSTTEQLQTL